MKTQLILVKTILILSFQYIISHTLAQSAADNVSEINTELSAFKSNITKIIKSAQANPDELIDGTTNRNLARIQPDLDSVSNKINEALDLVSQKEVKLNTFSGLGDKEILELKQALKSQRIPLENHQKTAAKLNYDIRVLIDSKIPELATVYKSFKDIAGKEKAQAKVQERMEQVLSAYLPQKPSPTPTPRPSPSATPRPATNLNSPTATDLQAKKPASSSSKKPSLPLWGPTDKLPKDVKGHRLAGQFAIQGSTVDAEVILVPAKDADKPFARQFWVVNRRFQGGARALVPIGSREIITIPKNKPMIFLGRGILPGIYNVEMQ